VELEHLESLWQESRERAATEGMAAGLAPLEHSHWDWRNKIDSVEAGRHLLIAVECQDAVQGIMAILRTPRQSQFTGELVVYVDYLEAAPWNLKGSSTSPRFVGIGTVLIADAIRLSRETGLDSRACMLAAQLLAATVNAFASLAACCLWANSQLSGNTVQVGAPPCSEVYLADLEHATVGFATIAAFLIGLSGFVVMGWSRYLSPSFVVYCGFLYPSSYLVIHSHFLLCRLIGKMVSLERDPQLLAAC
jgi:hypothetical protein